MDFDLLNVTPHMVSKDLKGYSFLIYGQPKAGKTSLASHFPKTLLIGFERGWNAIPGIKALPVDKWADFKKIVKGLNEDAVKSIYDNIIVDTGDLAFAACEQFVFNREGVDGYSGIPYGQGYSMVEKEFDKPFREIQNMGYGLIVISHAKEKTMNVDTPQEHSKMMPTMPKKGFEVISKLTDIISYIAVREIPLDKDNPAKGTKEERFMFMRDTKDYFAGSRFKHMQPVVRLGFEPLVEAIHLAIDKEAEETGNNFVTDKKDTSKQIVSLMGTRNFSETKAEFTALTQEIYKADNTRMAEITSVVEKHLGKGKKVSDCTPDQQSIVELIIDDLKDIM